MALEQGSLLKRSGLEQLWAIVPDMTSVDSCLTTPATLTIALHDTKRQLVQRRHLRGVKQGSARKRMIYKVELN